jgi:hypothetical protein
MSSEDDGREGVYRYEVDTSVARSGLHGFTVRVRPYHPDMPTTFIPGLITWAEAAKVAEPAVV